ncbi:multidrug resistance efflux transporter family protein [Gluconacetobacter entanii]|uniref:multidrug resistance efflux transporter family protein n=1 Tax=Gluconacetobacter entanii TaxID=108528 RepID=UPI0021BBEC18|nr:multidrug resistance efflux transporter family protein [Gluconacetobacter entanii]MCW4579347.1 multidrug resistance efflux transporter family protein [Gluconacetobacter entanii]MCW4582732.1 multidrug resistance efflux transporter family protein [Gluconacetobacter entanii]MCW4586150.1 multidrug resistance efflux transporter family protein [Gluconacetobacter entanii]
MPVTSGPAAGPAPGMSRLLGIGLLAAALFSITFVLNCAMSLGGGHWVWSASLRYFDMALLLVAWLLVRRGPHYLGAVLRLFRARLGFWLLAGGIGFGVFYACCCFAADHAPGWIVAATWQLTILATPFVLRAFGIRVPLRGLVFLGLIFLGVLTLNLQRAASGVGMAQILAGVVPVMVAAVAYPVGNQLLNRAKHAGDEASVLLADPVAAVLLLTLGALPVFLGLVLCVRPPPPDAAQVGATALIALVAGCLATTLFLYARNLSNDPLRIAAVDATQAAEVAFALLGEMFVLGAAPPDLPAWLGLVAVMGGLVGFTFQERA